MHMFYYSTVIRSQMRLPRVDFHANGRLGIGARLLTSSNVF